MELWGISFILSKLIRQGCLLAPYLFILIADVFKHMLNNPKYEVESLILLKRGIFKGQNLC